VLIFDDLTGERLDVDFRGTPSEVAQRIDSTTNSGSANHSSPSAGSQAKRPGRPKLGVVAREVTLLPRHWEWLASQPGGASVALRKLVDQAIKTSREKDEVRRAQEAAYRFVSIMAGNKPHYEEAIRALFAGQQQRFEEMIQAWPADVGDHARKLAVAAFRDSPGPALTE
jgi:hypothetical protein